MSTLALTCAAALVATAGTAQAAPAPSSADNVEILVEPAVAADLPGTEELLADAVVADVLAEEGAGIATLDAQEREVRVDIRETSDDSAFGVAIIAVPVGSEEAPEAWLFAADHGAGGWEVGLEGSAEFSDILADSTLLDTEQREAVAAATDPEQEFTAAAYIGVGLPFAIGTSMIMTGGPHGWGSGHPYSSVDFAGGNGQARAARGGYAYSLCTGWTRVIHDNGYSTDYYHLENYQWLPGNNVGVGHYLGTQGNSLCAGGSSTGAHIHFGLRAYTDPNAAGWYVPLHGKTLGGWTFAEGAAYGGYVYRSGVGTVYPGGSVYNYGF
ncbi:M23 family metallopeptidase [Nocardiopsis dassonvillei]|uniref:M23 family metallopeptidase n=1 Tax=Nocardiopsis dassonvillei TaxID=2014 RepID=UPI003F57143C